MEELRVKTINLLLKRLRTRLGDLPKKVVTRDADGKEVEIDNNIFTTDQLVAFLEASLCDFNCVPPFTMFTFDNYEVCDLISSLLTQHAVYVALTSQALIERGREYSISCNGNTFSSPQLSELICHIGDKEYDRWYVKVKDVKREVHDKFWKEEE